VVPDINRYKELTGKVRDILLKTWDPIRVQEFPIELRRAATDEYDAYVDPIVQMILAGERLEVLEAYLFNTETQAMGQKPIHSRAAVAAQILSDLENEFADRH